MSGTWPKIIRDPVHNIISFEDNRCDRLLLELINSKEFQRLRRIKQLGMSELIFPGANHSRFAHSIGVMSTARRLLDRLDRISGKKLDEGHRTAVLAASLLHDIGHGPFSHTFEKVSGEKHEVRTLEIILDSSTEVNECLRKSFDANLPETLAVFFDEDVEEARRDAVIPAYLTQIVSSQLDADRFDYLLRDSYATGTDYGLFDIDWLLEHLNLDNGKKRFYLTHKGLMAAETYVFARYHMYRTVYFHKTTRAAEVMLRLLFKRYKELLKSAATDTAKRDVVKNSPPNIFEAFSQKVSLAIYLELDDHAISEFLRACRHSEDPILKTLGDGLLNRRLFKAIEASDADRSTIGKFHSDCVELLRSKQLSPDYYFECDAPSDTPYKPYDPDDDKPATQIYVATTLGEPMEISKQSDAIAQLKRPYKLLRYYFPESIRDDIKSLAKEKLRKE